MTVALVIQIFLAILTVGATAFGILGYVQRKIAEEEINKVVKANEKSLKEHNDDPHSHPDSMQMKHLFTMVDKLQDTTNGQNVVLAKIDMRIEGQGKALSSHITDEGDVLKQVLENQRNVAIELAKVQK